MYVDLLLLAALLLLATTFGSFLLYYRRMKKTQEEYRKARNVIGDIVTSFNSQLEKQGRRLGMVLRQIETVSSETERVAEKIEGYDNVSTSLAKELEVASQAEKKTALQIQGIGKKVDEIGKVQEELSQKLREIERTERELQEPTPKTSIEAAIPIRKDKALAPLTETELGVLEILAEEGQMTAPEIREKISLTREHTSRLMKKLYGDGYLERNTGKMPYVYSIKEEMLKILRRRAAKPTE
jgi:uncharacterized membrane protein